MFSTAVLVPFFCGCVLPIAIVLLICLKKMNSDNKRAQIITKAIEANKDVDTDKLIESLKSTSKTEQEILNGRLLRGCIYTLIGVVLVIVGIMYLFSGSEISDDPVTFSFLCGGISLAIGISYLIVYFVTRKQVFPSDKE